MDMEDDRDDSPPYFHRRTNSYDLNSRIMLTAIISLSMVVILVTILHVYARFVLRRQARRRAALGQLGITTTTQVHPVEAPKTGLDPSTIALLPLLVFKDRDQDLHHDDDMGRPSKECPVCLSVFEDGEMVRVLPNCKHNFHAECIDKWLCSTSTCPICRTEAQPRLTPEAREPMVVNHEAREPLERMSTEETSDGTVQPSAKVNGSSSRLSSFRRMLNRDRPSQRIQSCGQDVLDDLERQ